MSYKLGKWFPRKHRRKEVPDQTRREMPVGFNRPPTIEEMIQKYIPAMSEAVKAAGGDSFDDWDDFSEPPDPEDLDSSHELVFDAALGKDVSKAEKRYLDAERKRFDDFVAEERKAARKKKRAPEPAPVPDEAPEAE